MKKWFVLGIICAAGIMSCGKKIAPGSDMNNPARKSGDKTSGSETKTATSNSNTSSYDSKNPSFNNSQKTATPIPDGPRSVSPEKGKTVFVTKCAGCHALKNPGDYTVDQMNIILKTEIPKANLSDMEGTQLTAYLLANAKK